MARPGNRTVTLGDSITAAAGYTNPVGKYVDVASQLSYGRMRIVKNAGNPGDTTAQMLARFDTDVTPWAPTMVTFMGGINDYATSVSPSVTKANYQTFAAKCHAIGAVPVFLSMCANNNTSATASIVSLNVWLRDYCDRNGLIYVDTFTATVDPATGAGLSGYFRADGTHPSAIGHGVIGEALNAALTPYLPPQRVALGATTADSTNLLTDPLFTGTPTSGLASGWLQKGTNDSMSVVTDATIKGNWQRFVNANAPGGGAGITQLVSAAPVLNHKYALTGLIKVNSNAEDFGQLAITIGGNGSIGTPLQVNVTHAMTGAFQVEGTLTNLTGTTLWGPSIVAYNGQVDAQVAQLTLRDLTALGLA